MVLPQPPGHFIGQEAELLVHVFFPRQVVFVRMLVAHRLGAAAHFQLAVVTAAGQLIQAVGLPACNGDERIRPGVDDIANGMEPGFFQLARRHPADTPETGYGKGRQDFLFLSVGNPHQAVGLFQIRCQFSQELVGRNPCRCHKARNAQDVLLDGPADIDDIRVLEIHARHIQEGFIQCQRFDEGRIVR